MKLRLFAVFVVIGSLLATVYVFRTKEQTFKVVWKSVREDGLVATYLRPKGDDLRPTMIVLGGSEGGIKSSEWLAHRFAERGWAVLAVAYFGLDGLPHELANIPLEYFDTAVSWVQRQPMVDNDSLTVVGASRGGELALLLASHNPAVKRVVAYCPSSVVWGPVGKFSDKTISAWTLGGKPLPHVSPLHEPDYSRQPFRGTPFFIQDLKQSELVAAATIPVEKIQGPVLMITGEDDQLWPSTMMGEMIMKRLTAFKHPYHFEHVSYPGAGHGIVPGIDPSVTEFKHPIGIVVALGGNKRDNRTAQNQGWIKVMEFLKADFRPMLPIPAESHPP